MAKSSGFALFTIFAVVGVIFVDISLGMSFAETAKSALIVLVIGGVCTFIKILVEKFEKGWDKRFG